MAARWIAWVGLLAALVACGGAPSTAVPEPAPARERETAPAPEPDRAALPACEAPDPAATELTDYIHLSPGKRYWVEVTHDSRYDQWRPAEQLDMPMHHASRLDWRNLGDYPPLADARAERLRFTFDLESVDIEKVPRQYLWMGTYGARIVGVCMP